MKYFLFVLNHFIQSFFAYLTFPMDCGLCNKNAFTMPLCTNCQKKLLSEKIENRCKTCGRELFFEKDFCTKCRQEGNSFSIFKSVHPEFMYVLQKKQLLYLWKVANNRNMVFFFAKIVFRILQEQYPNLPLIPVPPRPNKIKQKGWDQIEDLVFILEKKYKIKVLRILERVNQTQQKKLSKDKRFSESKKSFIAKEVKTDKLPKKVVLLDDIITTGATLNSCSEVLFSLGIEEINCVSLFIVP